ncbi:MULTISPECIES: hypothetical protein [Acinetobacter]|uniref:Uncharacterized protein n=1 Tax=Acinetobacter ursingii TaxID=108980 RepID=A0AA46NZK0_9GAMM|nr:MULTISPECIES: hypothetical protein [Acinetobacter]AYA67000.1 hypothetical protein CDG62_00790 [Acinetobacter sp. WCHA55]UYF73746.1 hypothetical protein LSO60_18710 [Acinetobacter ursingii]
MNKVLKKQIAFFILLLCGVGLYNYKAIQPQQQPDESIERAQQREAEFMQRKAEYIAKHGGPIPAAQQMHQELAHKNGMLLIKPPSTNLED